MDEKDNKKIKDEEEVAPILGIPFYYSDYEILLSDCACFGWPNFSPTTQIPPLVFVSS